MWTDIFRLGELESILLMLTFISAYLLYDRLSNIISLSPNDYKKIRPLKQSSILLSISLIVLTYLSMVLYNWTFVKADIPKIQNYFILITLVIVISISFSIIKWVVSLNIVEPYYLMNNFNEEISKIKIKKSEIDNLKRREGILEKFLLLEKKFVEKKNIDIKTFDFYKMIEHRNIGINSPIYFIHYFEGENGIDLIASEEHHVSTRNLNSKVYTIFFYLVDKKEYSFCFYSFKNENYLNFDFEKFDINGLKSNFKEGCEQLLEEYREKIRFEDDFKNNVRYIPLIDIIFNDLYELLSIRQGYIIPKAPIIKLIHLVFGLYKLLFLGTLITLIIKD